MKTRNTKLRQKDSEGDNNRMIIVGNLFFIVGACIMLTALTYMIGTDSYTPIWVLLTVAGVLLWIAGLVITLMKLRVK